MSDDRLKTIWLTSNGDRVIVYQDDSKEWRWHVLAPNNEIVGQGESHTTFRAAVEAAERHHPAVTSET